MTNQRYHEERKAFYSRIRNFWADLYGEEYALFDMKMVESNEIEQIRLTSERVGHIFFKVCHLLRNVPDQTLIDMGYPKETIPFIRLKTLKAESVISRLDLIPADNGYKCIEINADTPTFIKELFYINGEVCKEFSVENPNLGMDFFLSKTIRDSIEEDINRAGCNDPYVVFTAHEDNVEDRETVLYLQKVSGVSSKFIPLHKLHIQKGVGLFDDEGNQIDILYRQTFPIESLITDEDEEGNKIGIWLLELVQKGKLTVLNPPSAFLLQNKAVQGIIWGLHVEKHPFFTDEEHQWIERYFLPTFLEPDYFIESKISYVKKPAFGREGDTVEIYNEKGELVDEDVQKSYTEYLPVYQQFQEHPTTLFQSEKGKQEGKLLIGSFLLSGKPSAIGFRVGGSITNNLSYYLPVGMKKEG